MGPLRPKDEAGWDDGPSRPGVSVRRAIVVVIAAMLLVAIPLFLLLLWKMASPDPSLFGANTSNPLGGGSSRSPSRTIISTSTISLTIDGADWRRFVQAVDRFALDHRLADDMRALTVPSGDLGITWFWFTGQDADLSFNRKTKQAEATLVEIEARFYGFAPGAGERLKAAFEEEVIRSGRFSK
jgi:hypothetical protein